eukprot:5371403-Alexandrium_andersonii.AAC.1
MSLRWFLEILFGIRQWLSLKLKSVSARHAELAQPTSGSLPGPRPCGQRGATAHAVLVIK